MWGRNLGVIRFRSYEHFCDGWENFGQPADIQELQNIIYSGFFLPHKSKFSLFPHLLPALSILSDALARVPGASCQPASF